MAKGSWIGWPAALLVADDSWHGPPPVQTTRLGQRQPGQPAGLSGCERSSGICWLLSWPRIRTCARNRREWSRLPVGASGCEQGHADRTAALPASLPNQVDLLLRCRPERSTAAASTTCNGCWASAADALLSPCCVPLVRRSPATVLSPRSQPRPAQPRRAAHWAWIRAWFSGWCASGAAAPFQDLPICSNGSAFPLTWSKPDCKVSFVRGLGAGAPCGDDKTRSTGGVSRAGCRQRCDPARPFLPCCRCGHAMLACKIAWPASSSPFKALGTHTMAREGQSGQLFAHGTAWHGPDPCFALAAHSNPLPSPPPEACSFWRWPQQAQNGAAALW